MRSIYRVLCTGIAYNGVNSITGVSQWVHRVTIHNPANVLYHKHELHPMFTQVTCQQKIHCYITPSQQVCVLTHKLHQIHIVVGRGVARGGLRGLEHPLCMLYNDVIQTQVKLTLYCFATLTLLLKLVAFVFKLKFTVAELAISCSTSTALVYTSSYCFSLGS